jgi:hypothetical protein
MTLLDTAAVGKSPPSGVVTRCDVQPHSLVVLAPFSVGRGQNRDRGQAE